MTKIVNRWSFLTVQPDSGYPKYFGYNPHFGSINELGSLMNKLGEIIIKVINYDYSKKIYHR